jgi:hypothetical protein
VQQIEFAPFNYRQAPANQLLERSVLPSGSPSTVTLPAVGRKRPSTPTPSLESNATSTLQYNKGYITVRWSAEDPNGDPIAFKVELRRKGDTQWRVLKEKLQDRYYALDSTAFEDGRYVVRVTASDAPGNPPENALSSSFESDSFVIDNTPPEILNVAASAAGAKRTFKFTAKDALSWIDKAEYSINGGEWMVLEPVNKVTDSQSLDYQVQADNGQLVSVRVFDENDNVAARELKN